MRDMHERVEPLSELIDARRLGIPSHGTLSDRETGWRRELPAGAPSSARRSFTESLYTSSILMETDRAWRVQARWDLVEKR